jgi:hypothetical protein
MSNIPHSQDGTPMPPDIAPGGLTADGRPLVDITDRASRMPRNSTILYHNPPPCSGADRPSYRGLLRLLHDGKTFWVWLWPRTVRGQLVYEIELSPKEDGR